MFVASLSSNAGPVAVLLGGLGKCQIVAPRQYDGGALLSKPCVRPHASHPVPLGPGDPVQKVGRHD